MRYLVLIVMIIGITVAGAGMAQAIPISFPTNTVDFSGTGTDDGRTYLEIDDSNDSGFSYAYSHVLGSLIPTPQSIVSATLDITHKRNNYGNGELWFVSSIVGNIHIGDLSLSENPWAMDSFSLSSTVLAEMTSSNSWTLNLKFKENSGGRDRLWLDKSELSGTYEPVIEVQTIPEPATMSLLGLGLFGLGIRKKK